MCYLSNISFIVYFIFLAVPDPVIRYMMNKKSQTEPEPEPSCEKLQKYAIG